MEERTRNVDARLAALEQSFRALEVRLAHLESHAIAAPSDVDASDTTLDLLGLAGPTQRLTARVIALTGGALLALAGAYFLRALTESGTMAAPIGITMGFAYAAVWLALADRPRSATLSAGFHGAVACTIAFPLVWEATTKFQLLNAPASALLLCAVAGAALSVSAHRHLPSLAWIATFAALGFASGLVVATDRVLSYACATIALGVGTLWLGYVCDWFFLRWPVAFVADFLIAGAAFRVVAGNPHESGARVAIAALLLPAAYLVNIIVRTVVRGRDVIPFEVVQTLAGLGVGFATVLIVARHATFGYGIIGWGAALLGAACYAVAVRFIAARQHSRPNLYFYASIALLLVLASAALLTSEPAIPYALLAIVAAAVASRSPLLLVLVHAVVYTLAAILASTVVPAVAIRMIGTTMVWTPMTWTMLAVTVATGLSFVLAGRRDASMAPSIGRFVILVPFAWALSGWLVELIAPATARGPSGLDAGIVATVRTAVIAMLAIAAAAGARVQAVREVGWLVYPLLVGGGIKLIVDDIPHSRPATLFIALAVFGVALIAAPRLTHWGDDVPRAQPTR